MSDAVDDIEFDLGDDATDAGSLRKSFEKQLKELAKAKKALESELGALKQLARTSTLRETFASLVGEDRAADIAEFYSGEPDADSVKAWLGAKGKAFGISLDETPTPPGQPADENRQAMQRVHTASQGAAGATSGLQEAIAAINAVKPERGSDPYAALNTLLGNSTPG